MSTRDCGSTGLMYVSASQRAQSRTIGVRLQVRARGANLKISHRPELAKVNLWSVVLLQSVVGTVCKVTGISQVVLGSVVRYVILCSWRKLEQCVVFEGSKKLFLLLQ